MLCIYIEKVTYIKDEVISGKRNSAKCSWKQNDEIEASI